MKLRITGVMFWLVTIPTMAQAGPTAVGVAWDDIDSPIYLIDVSTGQSDLASFAGFSRLNSLAATQAGQLYSADDSRLVRINPHGPAGDVAVTIGSNINLGTSIRGLAFSPKDVLYAINNGDPPDQAGSAPDPLYILDRVTGAAQLVGSTGFAGIQGLDFAADGTLYAWDVFAGLLKVNPVTGLATDVNPAIGGTADIQTIAFAPNGVLYGARNGLYVINPATGAFTLSASLGDLDIRGLEFVAEPSAGCLAAIAMLGLFAYRVQASRPRPRPELDRQSTGKLGILAL
jgi:hypothetical protein